MSEARSAILGRIRSALDAGSRPADAADRVDGRLRAHVAGIIPERGRPGNAACVAEFIAEAERVNATVARVAGPTEAAKEIARYLASNNLPPVLKLAPDAAVTNIPWAEQTLLSVSQGPAGEDDTASVSHALAAVAETGTVVMTSSPDNPTTLNYLPPTHVVLIDTADILGSYEETWVRIRHKAEQTAETGGFMPRAVNWITGPSRTADIEQTLLLGMHGPQRLHIVIVDEEDA
jgi:L-lactate dehydrogenase complex protein LldG